MATEHPSRPGLFPDVRASQLGAPLHLSVDEFNEELLTFGSSAELRRATWCPCIRIDTRQADASCERCRGNGHYYPPELREPVMVLDVSRSASMRWAAAGLVAQGEVTMTFPCGIIPGQFDMVLPDDDHHVVNQVLFAQRTRRLTDTDHLRTDRTAYSGALKQPQVARYERLLYPTDVCIESVHYEDEDGTLCKPSEGAHYRLRLFNEWEWIGDAGPPPGGAWVVRYRAPAAYIVQGAAPLVRRAAGEVMPYRATLRRLDKVSADDLR